MKKTAIKLLLAMAAGLSFSAGCVCAVYAQPGVSAEPSYADGDYTSLQYNADGPFGIDVEGWNTCDANGHAAPAVDTSDIVVAVVDTGVDYTHL